MVVLPKEKLLLDAIAQTELSVLAQEAWPSCYARRTPVYALAPIADPFLMSLVNAVVSTEEFLGTACA